MILQYQIARVHWHRYCKCLLLCDVSLQRRMSWAYRGKPIHSFKDCSQSDWCSLSTGMTANQSAWPAPSRSNQEGCSCCMWISKCRPSWFSRRNTSPHPASSEQEHEFVNRKGFHSINVQVNYTELYVLECACVCVCIFWWFFFSWRKLAKYFHYDRLFLFAIIYIQLKIWL